MTPKRRRREGRAAWATKGSALLLVIFCSPLQAQPPAGDGERHHCVDPGRREQQHASGHRHDHDGKEEEALLPLQLRVLRDH